MTLSSVPPSPQAQAMLRALQEAIRKNLDRKRRLGQYAVIWQDGKAINIGDDAPKTQR